MDKLVKYVKDTAAEMKQVSWPTQHQALLYTALVIGISIVVSFFVGAFDHIFSQGISALINRI
ncbi:preprotein translocase subunit SecE [Candidatus Kaiserbacteria bacterium]|nr:preprotein translocase subunit SecE [Candidatus Kaiserbacteria bacterium]